MSTAAFEVLFLEGACVERVEVVDAEYGVATRQQAFAYMTSNEAGRASNDDPLTGCAHTLILRLAAGMRKAAGEGALPLLAEAAKLSCFH